MKRKKREAGKKRCWCVYIRTPRTYNTPTRDPQATPHCAVCHYTTLVYILCFYAPKFKQTITLIWTIGLFLCIHHLPAGSWRILLLLTTYERQTVLRVDGPNWEHMGNNKGVMDRHKRTWRRWNPDVTSLRNMSPGFWWILVKIAIETVLLREPIIQIISSFWLCNNFLINLENLINLGIQKWKHKSETILVTCSGKNKSEFF
jgi:hypothetical protein